MHSRFDRFLNLIQVGGDSLAKIDRLEVGVHGEHDYATDHDHGHYLHRRARAHMRELSTTRAHASTNGSLTVTHERYDRAVRTLLTRNDEPPVALIMEAGFQLCYTAFRLHSLCTYFCTSIWC